MSSAAGWTYALDIDMAATASLPAALRAALMAEGGAGSTLDEILAASDDAPGTIFRLDAAGLIVRTLHGPAGALATCRPVRAPDRQIPAARPDDELHLSPAAVARREDAFITLETPSAWAGIVVRDPSLLPLLGALAAGCRSDKCANALPGHSADTIAKLLQLFDWCELLAGSHRAAVLAPHEQLMHARTRLGYRRQPIGKTGTQKPKQRTTHSALATVHLPRVDDVTTPSLDALLRARKSLRHHGPTPMQREQLSQILYRTLGCQDGRRSYPSGGGCYPLNGYLAIRLCQDVPPGLYAYLPDEHVLSKVANDSSELNQLLREAAAAAAQPDVPQILLILSADFTRIAPVYEGLSYSLVLKETGAVMQTAMLAAAAAGLAACPLGTGNSRLFSGLAGLDPTRETSVGEVMLGTPMHD